MIIIKVFVKCKILSTETILSAYMRTNTHTDTHTYMQAHTCRHTHAHTRTHTRTHTHTHTHTQTHTHAGTHSQSLVQPEAATTTKINNFPFFPHSYTLSG